MPFPPYAPASPLPSYTRPPVIEVAVGIGFKELEQLQTRHLGQFWVSQANEFPLTFDLAPVPPESEERLTVFERPPLRRMAMFSSDGKYIGQVQSDRFYFNWRKKAEEPYPRFGEVFKRSAQLWSDFASFTQMAGVGKIEPQQYELAYINHIQTEGDLATQLEKYVRVFNFSPLRTSYLSAPPVSVSTAWDFVLPDGVGVGTASLSYAKERDKGNLVVLVLSCKTLAENTKLSLTDWFEAAHQWIVRSFTELTTDTAHSEWGRTQ